MLATSGASAPFIGLFGTVVGILVAFQSMAIMGTGGFSVVAAGISEALDLDGARTRGRDRRGYLLQLFFGQDSEHQRAFSRSMAIADRRGAARETGRWPLVDPKGGGGVFADINITPLTDIFLVLLIIFMVTTSVTVESAAHVDLPLAENTSPENKGVIVTYTSQHELFVNSKDVPERELVLEPA